MPKRNEFYQQLKTREARTFIHGLAMGYGVRTPMQFSLLPLTTKNEPGSTIWWGPNGAITCNNEISLSRICIKRSQIKLYKI